MNEDDVGAPTAEPPGPPESPPPPARPPYPPDPAAYDSERNQAARARGLSAPYIRGGLDPNPEAGRREERIYGQLLIGMVIAIILAGFMLGIAANLIGLLGGGS